MKNRAFGTASLTRLRVMIVALVAVVVTVVIAVSFSIVVWMQHSSNVSDMYSALETTLGSAAQEYEMTNDPNPSRPTDAPDNIDTPPDTTEALPEENLNEKDSSRTSDEHGSGFAIGRWRNNADMLVPAAVYFIDTDGTFTYMTQYSTASLDTDDVETVIESVTSSSNNQSAARGYLKNDSLYYAKKDAGGGTLVAFADGAIADQWKYLAATLALVGLCIVILAIIGSTIFAHYALLPIEEAWTRQQRFIADASHELKTPLSVILANTAIELEHPSSTIAEQSQWIKSTHKQAIRMQTLVHEMLELAQADANTFDKSKNKRHFLFKRKDPMLPAGNTPEKQVLSKIDLSDLVEGCTLTFEPMMYEAKVKLKADIKPNIWTKGDPERLTRLVSIFLDNASKYTPEGGEVSVLLTTSGRLATLSVTNTSTPLSKDQLDHVFDRFYKVDPARSDETSYGLGLAIAQEIALSMGGKIEVIAINELPGNTFVTTLPCV